MHMPILRSEVNLGSSEVGSSQALMEILRGLVLICLHA